MSDKVTAIKLIPNHPDLIPELESGANMCVPDVGEVMIITNQAEDIDDVEVLLVFPVLRLKDDFVDDDELLSYRPAGIKFSLNTFLNAARALAIEHHARTDDSEAKLVDDVQRRLIHAPD